MDDTYANNTTFLMLGRISLNVLIFKRWDRRLVEVWSVLTCVGEILRRILYIYLYGCLFSFFMMCM